MTWLSTTSKNESCQSTWTRFKVKHSRLMRLACSSWTWPMVVSVYQVCWHNKFPSDSEAKNRFYLKAIDGEVELWSRHGEIYTKPFATYRSKGGVVFALIFLLIFCPSLAIKQSLWYRTNHISSHRSVTRSRINSCVPKGNDKRKTYQGNYQLSNIVFKELVSNSLCVELDWVVLKRSLLLKLRLVCVRNFVGNVRFCMLKRSSIIRSLGRLCARLGRPQI